MTRFESYKTLFDPVTSGYTHLEFKARMGAMDADRPFVISIGGFFPNGTWSSSASIDLSSLACSNEQPTTDDRWSVVRVPLAELGLKSGMNVAGFYLAHQTGVKLLEGYFDGIQFAAYTTSKFHSFEVNHL